MTTLLTGQMVKLSGTAFDVPWPVSPASSCRTPPSWWSNRCGSGWSRRPGITPARRPDCGRSDGTNRIAVTGLLGWASWIVVYGIALLRI
ncbi:hypothetical protein [Nonomuraea sp. B5E05]|uniref:hypothetical protein n=1 Tax=Nonomuraea sp. B5E05 TaxID=3153569 RepID=UPI003260B55B